VRLVRSGQVDGVILFTGRLPRDDGGALAPGQVPLALVCNEIPGEDGVSVFDVANRAAARKAVEYLIEHGHRRIAHISGPADNVEAIARQQGYRDALRAAGLAVDSAYVWEGGFRFDAGVAGGVRYLDLARRPTAVFAAADDAAIGFIRTVRRAGVRVPEDVSVIGFDDIDSAELIDPPLTTMHQPRAELGRAAAQDLVNRMVSGSADLPPTRLRLACELVERGSVRRVSPTPEERRRAVARASGRLSPTSAQ
jgi:LacI family repressor for deo operon, udp, cdd, tsx, nupC, and nupG